MLPPGARLPPAASAGPPAEACRSRCRVVRPTRRKPAWPMLQSLSLLLEIYQGISAWRPSLSKQVDNGKPLTEPRARHPEHEVKDLLASLMINPGGTLILVFSCS